MVRRVHYTNTCQQSVWHAIPDLIRSRDLLVDLVFKDLRVRYRYAAMGFLWAVLEPLALTLILTFVFSVVFKNRIPASSGGAEHPYPVFILCGLIPWQFFSQSVSAAAHCFLDNRNLVQKVNFPREVLPLATIGVFLVNLVIGAGILLAVHLAFGGGLGRALAYIPLLFVIQLGLVVGLALVFSCLNVFYRDVSYIVGVAMTFGFYATPIFYQLRDVQASLGAHSWLYRLYLVNPMAGLVTSYRQAFLDNVAPDWTLTVWPALAALGCLAGGVALFRRYAGFMADHL